MEYIYDVTVDFTSGPSKTLSVRADNGFKAIEKTLNEHIEDNEKSEIIGVRTTSKWDVE